MSFQAWLGQSMARDCRICIHLFQKFPESLHGWRPSEGQRSVEELLQYLSICAIAALKGAIEPDKGWRDHYVAQSKAMKAAQFPEFMEKQAQEIETFFASQPEAAFETIQVKQFYGDPLPMGQSIINGPAKYLAAYKMQLFLYAKQNGIAVGTPNLWRGTDPQV